MQDSKKAPRLVCQDAFSRLSRGRQWAAL